MCMFLSTGGEIHSSKTPKTTRRDASKSINKKRNGDSSFIVRSFSVYVLPDVEVRQTLLVGDFETLLVRQVKETDEAVGRGDVRHHLLRVDALEVVHDRREFERAIICFRHRSS